MESNAPKGVGKIKTLFILANLSTIIAIDLLLAISIKSSYSLSNELNSLMYLQIK